MALCPSLEYPEVCPIHTYYQEQLWGQETVGLAHYKGNPPGVR